MQNIFCYSLKALIFPYNKRQRARLYISFRSAKVRELPLFVMLILKPRNSFFIHKFFCPKPAVGASNSFVMSFDVWALFCVKRYSYKSYVDEMLFNFVSDVGIINILKICFKLRISIFISTIHPVNP